MQTKSKEKKMHESSYRKVIIYLWVQKKYYNAQFIDLHTYILTKTF